jgi:hypothetical protein
MYRVYRQGKIIQRFNDFLDAWLFIYLDLYVCAYITGPDGTWVINPGQHSIN